jgi:hypothetical protein
MGWKGVVMFLLSFLLAISLAVTIIGLQGFSLLSANAYLPTLEKHGAYANFAGSFGEEGMVLSNETLKEIVELVAHRSFDYVNGRTDTLNLTLDLQSDLMRATLIKSIAQLPICTGSETASSPPCRPENLSAEEAFDLAIKEGAISADKQLIDLGPIINKDDNLTNLREKVHTYKLFVYSAVIISIVLIMLLLLIGWSSRSRGFRNIGIPIILAGIGILSGTYLGFAIALQTISSYETLGGDFNPIIILGDILAGLKMRLLISGIVLIIVGLIVFVSSFIFARKEEKAEKEK